MMKNTKSQSAIETYKHTLENAEPY